MSNVGRIGVVGILPAMMADEAGGGSGAATAPEEVASGIDTEINKLSEEHSVEDANKKLQALALKQKKVDLLLKATGDAPIMKQKKWTVEADRKIGSIILFIKKYLKLDPTESLFVYVNQAFAPSPDQLLRNLYECFGTDGKLVLHYCRTQAWG